MSDLTQAQKDTFNEHVNAGAATAQNIFTLAADPRKKLGAVKKKEAKEAIVHFKKCVAILPSHWQSFWLMGRLQNILNNDDEAFVSFQSALAIEGSNAEVAQEAAALAMMKGEIELALEYSSLAITREPDNTKTLGNHALFYLVAEQDNEAAETIKKALTIDPKNAININIELFIQEVINGTKERPSFDELG